MDKNWIEWNIGRMQNECPTEAVKETGKLLESNMDKVRRKINVVDGSTKNRWNQLKMPKDEL